MPNKKFEPANFTVFLAFLQRVQDGIALRHAAVAPHENSVHAGIPYAFSKAQCDAGLRRPRGRFDGGGKIVAEGTHEGIIKFEHSYTGQFFKDLLERRPEADGGGGVEPASPHRVCEDNNVHLNPVYIFGSMFLHFDFGQFPSPGCWHNCLVPETTGM
ncbi:hypothetical protein [Hoeflea sp.]|uniref:hypothetical protein n=1 Tax=Hoeflea sp. TaxID=1940281 RepID=UPI002AFF7078|nr:hypothetical protein [Hoeflea sp.]